MIRTGFRPALCPGASLSQVQPHPVAYIQLWQQERRRCELAYAKLQSKSPLVEVESPDLNLVFPLLPVVKGKDKWRHEKYGSDYKVRLTHDSSTAGAAELFARWPISYVGLRDLPGAIGRGFWLATRDIDGFYTRLGASKLLRRLQRFQDPSTYAATPAANRAKLAAGDATILEQSTCMFGHPQLPAWASCVSSELVRILRSHGIMVVGIRHPLGC